MLQVALIEKSSAGVYKAGGLIRLGYPKTAGERDTNTTCSGAFTTSSDFSQYLDNIHRIFIWYSCNTGVIYSGGYLEKCTWEYNVVSLSKLLVRSPFSLEGLLYALFKWYLVDTRATLMRYSWDSQADTEAGIQRDAQTSTSLEACGGCWGEWERRSRQQRQSESERERLPCTLHCHRYPNGSRASFCARRSEV